MQFDHYGLGYREEQLRSRSTLCGPRATLPENALWITLVEWPWRLIGIFSSDRCRNLWFFQVYKCEALASNCGRCLTLNAEKYEAGVL